MLYFEQRFQIDVKWARVSLRGLNCKLGVSMRGMNFRLGLGFH